MKLVSYKESPSVAASGGRGGKHPPELGEAASDMQRVVVETKRVETTSANARPLASHHHHHHHQHQLQAIQLNPEDHYLSRASYTIDTFRYEIDQEEDVDFDFDDDKTNRRSNHSESHRQEESCDQHVEPKRIVPSNISIQGRHQPHEKSAISSMPPTRALRKKQSPHNLSAKIQYQKPPPIGLPPGGIWTQRKYVGTTTIIAMVVGCFCMGIFSPLVLCCCPSCDEEDVYIIHNKMYAVDGHFLAIVSSSANSADATTNSTDDAGGNSLCSQRIQR